MDDFGVSLKILTDILDKKTELLENILNITFNQRSLIISETKSENTAEYFRMMSGEKKQLIDEVMKADEVFQSTFAKIKDRLEENALRHKEEIRLLQRKIRNVSDLDAKIKVEEDKNRIFIDTKKKKTEKIITEPRSKVLEKYRKHVRKRINIS